MTKACMCMCGGSLAARFPHGFPLGCPSSGGHVGRRHKTVLSRSRSVASGSVTGGRRVGPNGLSSAFSRLNDKPTPVRTPP